LFLKSAGYINTYGMHTLHGALWRSRLALSLVTTNEGHLHRRRRRRLRHWR
jgi:hypothetical protein